MRVMSWNVNKSSNRSNRIDDQLAFIEDCDVDVLLLQEVRHASGEWIDVWKDGLADLGLGKIEHSCDWAIELADSSVPPHDDIGHDNGHITAVNDDWSLTLNDQLIRDRLEATDRSNFYTNFPEKILVTELETGGTVIELWNVRAVPGNHGLRRRSRFSKLCSSGFPTPVNEHGFSLAISIRQRKNWQTDRPFRSAMTEPQKSEIGMSTPS